MRGTREREGVRGLAREQGWRRRPRSGCRREGAAPGVGRGLGTGPGEEATPPGMLRAAGKEGGSEGTGGGAEGFSRTEGRSGGLRGSGARPGVGGEALPGPGAVGLRGRAEAMGLPVAGEKERRGGGKDPAGRPQVYCLTPPISPSGLLHAEVLRAGGRAAHPAGVAGGRPAVLWYCARRRERNRELAGGAHLADALNE